MRELGNSEGNGRRISEAPRSTQGCVLKLRDLIHNAHKVWEQKLWTGKSPAMKCVKVAENEKENKNLGLFQATTTSAAQMLNRSHRILNLSLVQNPQKRQRAEEDETPCKIQLSVQQNRSTTSPPSLSRAGAGPGTQPGGTVLRNTRERPPNSEFSLIRIAGAPHIKVGAP